MTDEERHRAERTATEYRETEASFAHVREILVNAIIASPINASDSRERYYLAVNVLDTVRKHMATILANAGADKTIEQFIADLGKPQEKTHGA